MNIKRLESLELLLVVQKIFYTLPKQDMIMLFFEFNLIYRENLHLKLINIFFGPARCLMVSLQEININPQQIDVNARHISYSLVF